MLHVTFQFVSVDDFLRDFFYTIQVDYLLPVTFSYVAHYLPVFEWGQCWPYGEHEVPSCPGKMGLDGHLKILVKLGICSIDFQNQNPTPTFFKNSSQLHRHSRVFLRHNFRNYFLFRINFRKISLIKIESDFNFWWTFF